MPFDIEAYLANRLTPTEKTAFETELAQNPALQTELAAARELHEHLATMRVREQVRAAIRALEPVEVAPETPHFSKFSRWFWVFLAVLAVAGGLFFLKNRSVELPPIEQIQSPKNETPPPIPENQTEKQVEKNAPAPPSKLEKQPIAAHFAPNATMENFINGGTRSSAGLQVTLEKPLRDAVFQPARGGLVDLRFAGRVEGLTEVPPAEAFTFSIFQNINLQKPLVGLPLVCSKNSAGQMVFDFRRQEKLPLGLYYFTIESEEGAMLIAGRFYVRE